MSVDHTPERTAASAPGTAPTPLQQLRRLWWIVVIVAVVASGLAFFVTSAQPTTYTGRASLIVSSNNRSPDQDAVLVQGYVDYFNDPAYQSQLTEEAGVDGDVSLDARAAAASPILLVQSTAPDPSLARSSAAAIAEAFQSDVNEVRDADQAAQVAELEARIAAVSAAGGADAPGSIASLQDQVAQVQADRTNRLQELQFDGGVSTNSPAVVNNVGLAGVGGLILGTLLALAVGRLTTGRRRPTGR